MLLTEIERPVESITFAFLVAGVFLGLISKIYPRDSKTSIERRASDFTAHLSSHGGSTFNISLRACPIPGLSKLSHSSLRMRQLRLIVIVGCIILRVETLRRIDNEVACSWRGVEVCANYIQCRHEQPGFITPSR